MQTLFPTAFHTHVSDLLCLSCSQPPDRDRLFILDSLHEIIVLCTAPEARTGVVFPPQEDCLLKRRVTELKAHRPVATPVSWIRSGGPEIARFEAHLIEESDVSGIGYEQFIQYINDEVTASLFISFFGQRNHECRFGCLVEQVEQYLAG